MWRLIFMVYGDAAFSIFLRVTRLQWAGDVERMNDCRTPRKVIGGRKSVGSPEVGGRMLFGRTP
jgi:hypothetical protein